MRAGRQSRERHRKRKPEPLHVAAGFHLDFQNCAATLSESQQTNQIPQYAVYWLYFYSAWKMLMVMFYKNGNLFYCFQMIIQDNRTLQHTKKSIKILSCLFTWSAIAKPVIVFLTGMRNFNEGQEYGTLKAMVKALSLWKNPIKWNEAIHAISCRVVTCWVFFLYFLFMDIYSYLHFNLAFLNM